MKEWNYRRGLFCALLIVVFLCLAQAITTEDLLHAGTKQSSEQISSFQANQPPLAKSLTPDQEGPLTAGSTIIWTGNAYDPDGVESRMFGI